MTKVGLVSRVFGVGIAVLAIYFFRIHSEEISESFFASQSGSHSFGIVTNLSHDENDLYLKDSSAFLFSQVPRSVNVKLRDSVLVGPKGKAKIDIAKEFGGGSLELQPNSIITFTLSADGEAPIIEVKQGLVQYTQDPKPLPTKTKKRVTIKAGNEVLKITDGAKLIVINMESEKKIQATMPTQTLRDLSIIEDRVPASVPTQSETVTQHQLPRSLQIIERPIERKPNSVADVISQTSSLRREVYNKNKIFNVYAGLGTDVNTYLDSTRSNVRAATVKVQIEAEAKLTQTISAEVKTSFGLTSYTGPDHTSIPRTISARAGMKYRLLGDRKRFWNLNMGAGYSYRSTLGTTSFITYKNIYAPYFSVDLEYVFADASRLVLSPVFAPILGGQRGFSFDNYYFETSLNYYASTRWSWLGSPLNPAISLLYSKLKISTFEGDTETTSTFNTLGAALGIEF